jgi:hypothetical protein
VACSACAQKRTPLKVKRALPHWSYSVSIASNSRSPVRGRYCNKWVFPLGFTNLNCGRGRKLRNVLSMHAATQHVARHAAPGAHSSASTWRGRADCIRCSTRSRPGRHGSVDGPSVRSAGSEACSQRDQSALHLRGRKQSSRELSRMKNCQCTITTSTGCSSLGSRSEHRQRPSGYGEHTSIKKTRHSQIEGSVTAPGGPGRLAGRPVLCLEA